MESTSGIHMTGLKFSELAPGSRLALWWSFLWRSFIIALGSTVCGALLGGVAGFILAIAGMRGGVAIVGMILGGVCGCAFVYLYVYWLLSSRLGKFRLIIVRADEP